MKYTLKFKIDIYGAEVDVIFTDADQAGLKRLMKKLYGLFGEEHEEDGAFAGCVFCPDIDPYKYFMVFSIESLSPGLIAHEVEHLKNNILHSFEYKMSTPDDEIPANLVELITDRIYDFIKKKRLKIH